MENCNAKATLAFDCSTPHASVALRVGGDFLFQAIEKGRHAAVLVPSIQALLQQADIGYASLDALVTTIGPGSFTGLRIALATVQGLHLATGIPIKTTSSLAALAHQHSRQHPDTQELRAVMDVGKGEIAYQDFSAGTATSEIIRIAINADSWRHTHLPCVGTLTTDGVYHQPCIDARTLCDMAPSLPITPLHEVAPIYIRPPDAIIPQAPRWLAS